MSEKRKNSAHHLKGSYEDARAKLYRRRIQDAEDRALRGTVSGDDSERTEVERTKLDKAVEEYLLHHFGVTASQLSRNPKTRWIYKQLWRHGQEHIVAHVIKQEGPWARDAWSYYVANHYGKTRGQINTISNAYYKALSRQRLTSGMKLPGKRVLERECRAIELVPRARTRNRTD